MKQAQTPINAESIKAAILNDIQDDLDNIKSHEAVIEILKQAEGKPINGRSLPDKKLNGYKMRTLAGMFHLDKDGKSHLIGYNSDPFISVSKFENFDACHGSAAKERIKQNTALLNDENRLNELVDLITSAYAHYEGLRQVIKAIDSRKFDAYHFPAHYNVMGLLQTEQEKQRVNLHDFLYL